MGSLWAFANCVFGLCLFVFSLVDSLLAFAVFAVYMFWTCCGQIVVVFKYGGGAAQLFFGIGNQVSAAATPQASAGLLTNAACSQHAD
jgi:hypothetical protein